MNEPPPDSQAVCPFCSTPLRKDPESAAGITACGRCGWTNRPASSSPPPTTASGSGSGVYAMVGPFRPEGAGHVEVSCPECGAGLRVRDKYVGRHVRCGGCRAKFLVEPATLDLAAAATTPDPDDPWQGRAEVLRLLDEVAALRDRNQRLQDEVARLERERDAATRELGRIRSEAESARARSGRERFRPDPDDADEDDPAATFTFLNGVVRSPRA
ncbi:FtsB family cell division protein [Planctomyces sp. SH-PL62]|uniref:FtsB family cell division protein n=1 Tax=Planctomyces sp. SH-PL62 TaxID=1636152 RepID=UPI00078DBA3F|nr:hypothetical protein [Planctomyces sp. SH-PL62]AMV35832.1 hypothetical protein VT85_00210 [Planctomyces sp. SH-PL62]